MSITAAEVLAEVNERLHRSETVVTDELRATLKDLSIRGDFLFDIDTTQTITTASTYLSEPSNFKGLVAIVLNDEDDGSGDDGQPLRPIDYDEYLRQREDETTADYDEPLYYCHANNKFYLEPTCDDGASENGYQAKIHYWRLHPDSTSTILFGDAFREAIYSGTTAKTAKKFKMPDQANSYEMDYEREVAKLLGLASKLPLLCKYNDI